MSSVKAGVCGGEASRVRVLWQPGTGSVAAGLAGAGGGRGEWRPECVAAGSGNPSGWVGRSGTGRLGRREEKKENDRLGLVQERGRRAVAVFL